MMMRLIQGIRLPVAILSCCLLVRTSYSYSIHDAAHKAAASLSQKSVIQQQQQNPMFIPSSPDRRQSSIDMVQREVIRMPSQRPMVPYMVCSIYDGIQSERSAGML